jgi:hypothetical protein
MTRDRHMYVYGSTCASSEYRRQADCGKVCGLSLDYRDSDRPRLSVNFPLRIMEWMGDEKLIPRGSAYPCIVCVRRALHLQCQDVTREQRRTLIKWKLLSLRGKR